MTYEVSVDKFVHLITAYEYKNIDGVDDLPLRLRFIRMAAPVCNQSNRLSSFYMAVLWRYYAKKYGFIPPKFFSVMCHGGPYIELNRVDFENEENYLLFLMKFN